jgi:hypothetical protein
MFLHSDLSGVFILQLLTFDFFRSLSTSPSHFVGVPILLVPYGWLNVTFLHGFLSLTESSILNPRYEKTLPAYRKLGGPQSGIRRLEKKKNCWPYQNSNPAPSSQQAGPCTHYAISALFREKKVISKWQSISTSNPITGPDRPLRALADSGSQNV